MDRIYKTTGIAVQLVIALFLFNSNVFSQIIDVGAGSYTTQFPGVDEAGRNTYPSGSPFTTGVAATKPAPTNDWWSAKIKNSHADNLFNYPFTLKTVNSGLVVTYIPWGVIDDILPVTVGVTGLNASTANVADFSDWTVTMDWSNAEHNFQATAGIGMPFLYFSKDSSDVAQVTVASGSVTIADEMLIITDARNGADFAVYAPTGSVWSQNGNTYTSDLNGENYWSLAFIPLDAPNVNTVANEYKKYAYVFPTNTTTAWDYDVSTSVMRTDFHVETDVKEGSDTTMLMGLLPHQWANLAADSPVPDKYAYTTVRGELKTMDGNSFSVENTFHGILPTLPYLDNYSDGFNPQRLDEKVKLLENEGLPTWTDSYNEGQSMNRLIQTARIADLMGNQESLDKILATIKERLEDWLKAELNEVAFIFYYNDTWTAMIGYPAGYGQDGNLNDHHFHWGYFIHAAAFVEQFEPGWASQWGEMVNLLVRDAASDNRDDDMFPFLRNFSPYAGHCWANGFATFPQGNDQESTSESMQFNSSLIHWGSITGNDQIRDLGIYLYTTEQSAVEEYWFDMYERNFKPEQEYSLVSRVWGNSYDNGTFWTNDIAASYGIELYPIHGGSNYLGQNLDYVEKLWNEIEENTGILENEANPNLWHDVMWQYLAFIDPVKAIELYDSYPERDLKFGISDAQTYHWLHAMNVLGNVDASRTADHPMAAAFSREGEVIYVAHNYKNEAVDVTFSDGYVLNVPPMRMATSKDISLTGNITSSFQEAYAGGSVDLDVVVSGGEASKVEFYDGGTLVGETSQAPHIFRAKDLFVGKHSFYAKIYEGEDFVVTNLVAVLVGEQLPFIGDAIVIPGTVEAASYDKFEGGLAQGISYNDVSPGNNGDFRLNEYVDATMHAAEGGTVGWIAAGEWLEYTIHVEEAGYYNLHFRYASGNTNGGGPFHLESDGIVISDAIGVNYTGDWNAWASKTVNGIPLKSGKQVLRVFFEHGEFNLGKMTFSYLAELDYSQPVADAGENILVMLPENTAALDGSNSSDPEGASLSYSWTQVYGPTTLQFSDQQVAKPAISPLVEGVYLLNLRVDNGSYSDVDDVYVISSYSSNIPPKVSIYSPVDQAEFIEFDSVVIYATASDLVGYVEQVDFYVDDKWIGSAAESPYAVKWTSMAGDYSLTAIAHDNDGDSTVSKAVDISLVPAPPCRGTAYNGEFDWEFSPDNNNPTLTFIPSKAGVGEPTCILYYGTNANSLPGYPVTPNEPYQLNASEGTKIYFYYTYSYPGEGEHNNSANKDSYEIGSCRPLSVHERAEELPVNYYPNPVTSKLTLDLPRGKNEVAVYRLTGEMITQFSASNPHYRFDMSSFNPGIYVFRVVNGDKVKMFKVIK
jgi:endoglucanase Acf2